MVSSPMYRFHGLSYMPCYYNGTVTENKDLPVYVAQPYPVPDIIDVTYDWGNNSSQDLDTMTTFMGVSRGWTPSGPVQGKVGYTYWTGDNTGKGPEVFTAYLKEAVNSGSFGVSQTIPCKAGWYSPSGGSGSATLIVTCDGVSLSQTISPGSQDGEAQTGVGNIVVYSTIQLNEDKTQGYWFALDGTPAWFSLE